MAFETPRWRDFWAHTAPMTALCLAGAHCIMMTVTYTKHMIVLLAFAHSLLAATPDHFASIGSEDIYPLKEMPLTRMPPPLTLSREVTAANLDLHIGT